MRLIKFSLSADVADIQIDITSSESIATSVTTALPTNPLGLIPLQHEIATLLSSHTISSFSSILSTTKIV